MAALSLIVEDFNDNSLDTTKWDLFGTAALFSETNQRAQFSLTDATTQSARLESKTLGDLTGDAVFCRMTGFRDGASSAEALFAVHSSDAANRLEWIVNNGTLLAKKIVGGTATTLLSTPWYPDLHAWVRIREAAGTTYWDTAPAHASNPPIASDWTNRHSAANPITVTSLKIRIHGGAFNTASTNTGIAIFDGINTAATVEDFHSSPLYVGIGTAVFGTTSVAPPFPAGAVAGDKALLLVSSKYNLPTTPAGWTLEASHVGGSGTAGVDAGNPYQALFSKDADGTETTATTVTVSQASVTGAAMAASIALFRKPSGSLWSFSSSKGVDTTGGGNWSATGDVAIGTRRHDLTLVASAINGDISTADAEQLDITGTQHGSVIEIRDAGTTDGDDLRSVITLHYATSGAGSSLPVYTFTSTNNTVATTPAGPSIFYNIRASFPLNASLSWTEASDTNAAAGSASNNASLAWTETSDTNNTAVNVKNNGAVAWTEDSDATTIAASVTASTNNRVLSLNAGTAEATAIVRSTNSATSYTFKGRARNNERVGVETYYAAYLRWSASDASNYYQLEMKSDQWAIRKVAAGTRTLLASGTNVLSPLGEWGDFAVEHNSTTGVNKVTLKGVLLNEFTDATPLPTGGFQLVGYSCKADFDEITGFITDNFESRTVGSYALNATIGDFTVLDLGGGTVSIRDVPEDRVLATVGYAEASDINATAGNVKNNGTVAWAEANDTNTAAVNVTNSSTVAWTEANDTTAIAGSAADGTVSGAVAWAEEADTIEATASVSNNATASWTEASDTNATAGNVKNSGAVSWVEDSDITAIAAVIPITSTVSWTEANDTTTIVTSNLDAVLPADGVHPGMYMRRIVGRQSSKKVRIKTVEASLAKVTATVGYASHLTAKVRGVKARARVARVIGRSEGQGTAKACVVKVAMHDITGTGVKWARVKPAKAAVSTVRGTGEAAGNVRNLCAKSAVGVVRGKGIINPTEEQLLAMFSRQRGINYVRL